MPVRAADNDTLAVLVGDAVEDSEAEFDMVGVALSKQPVPPVVAKESRVNSA